MNRMTLLNTALAAFFTLTGCGSEKSISNSMFLSHSTQRWALTNASPLYSATAESGSCATNLNQASLVGDFCFNAVPVAEVSASTSSGKLSSLCVATHLADGVAEAALIVLDNQGNIVAEALGRQSFQILASLPSNGTFRVFAGFPTSTPGQKVKVLAGRNEQFALGSVACSAK